MTWPREGSQLTIEGRATDSAPDTYANASTWRATWTYRNGDWHGTCQGSYAHDWADAYNEAGSPDTQGTFTATFEATDPPHWPLFNTRDPPAVGEEMTVWLMWDCDIRSTTMVYSGVEEGYHTADDTQVAEENYSDFDTQWDADSGLVWSWDWSRLHSSTHGRIVSTDHP